MGDYIITGARTELVLAAGAVGSIIVPIWVHNIQHGIGFASSPLPLKSSCQYEKDQIALPDSRGLAGSALCSPRTSFAV